MKDIHLKLKIEVRYIEFYIYVIINRLKKLNQHQIRSIE